MTNRINGSFDFRDADQNLVEKQIAELENAISFEKENIEICLTNSEMSGVCLDLGCGSIRYKHEDNFPFALYSYLVGSGLLKEEEFYSMLQSLNEFVRSESSFYQVGNYFTYGEVKK